MLETMPVHSYLRSLGPDDLRRLVELLDTDPHVNLFVRHRIDGAGLNIALLGAQVWGWFEGDHLVSACHVGANVVPICATSEALEAFAGRLLNEGARPASVVGKQDAVAELWARLEPRWGPARSPRPNQPFLQIESDPLVPADPRVRRVALDEVDTLYPASVAMFREEVGVDPETQSRGAYRARVTQLVARGLAFAIIENGRVLFKAEVGAATRAGCQLQGVWVAPQRRGEGIAAGALAAVVEQSLASIAPVVSLYVNEHNVAARRAYERVGFRHVETFASILL